MAAFPGDLRHFPHILLGFGLFFLGWRRDSWWKVLGGVAAACAFWLLPVLPYLHDGAIAAFSHAMGFFTDVWFNHSFLNLFHRVSPGLAPTGRILAFGFTLFVSVGCWWHARSALRAGDHRATVLWVGLFATASLLTMVGFSTLSYIYNQILILPGVLFFPLVGDGVWKDLGFHPRTQRLPFMVECLGGSLLVLYVLPPLPPPLAAVGYALLALLLGIAMLARLRQPRVKD